jgi:hypothetical protein
MMDEAHTCGHWAKLVVADATQGVHQQYEVSHTKWKLEEDEANQAPRDEVDPEADDQNKPGYRCDDHGQNKH